MATRDPNFAAQFYPGDPDSLRRMIEGFMDQSGSLPAGEIFGAVSPHAGYQYSGAVAVFSHLAYRDLDLDRIVIIGPSHQSYFKDPIVDDCSAWRTPLGESEVDQEAVAVLVSSGLVSNPRPFDVEHSLEVQLPFIQAVKPGAKIVPIMLGDQGLDNCKKVGEAIGRLPGQTFIIASSDLYHGYSYEECKATDQHTIETILKLDPQKLSQEIRAERAMACGAGPIGSLLHYGGLSGIKSAEVLKYTNSNEVTGTTGGYCVGYVSIVFSR